MKIFIFAILFIFAIFGLSEFLHVIKLKVFRPKEKMCWHIVINLQNPIAERQMMFAFEQLKWHGRDFADFIIFNCDDLNSDTYVRCNEIANKYNVNLPKKFDL